MRTGCTFKLSYTFSSVIIFVTILTMSTTKVDAEPRGLPSLRQVANAADLIAVGTATFQPGDSTQSIMKISVVRILKGNVKPGTSVTVQLLQGGAPCKAVANDVSINAIWFLQSTTDGIYRFAPYPLQKPCQELEAEYSTVPGDLPSKWTYSPSLSTVDKLAYEIAFATDGFAGEGPLALDLNPALLDEATQDSKTAIYQLLSSSISPTVSLAGTTGLVRLGDSKALRDLAYGTSKLSQQALPTKIHAGAVTLKRSAASTKEVADGESTPQLAASVAKVHNESASTVAELGNILRNSSSPLLIQQAAAEALQNIHSASATEIMASYLDSTDVLIRDYAIGTLACFANAVPVLDYTKLHRNFDINQLGPLKTTDTMDHFALGTPTIDKNHDQLQKFWDQWWNSNSNKIEKMATQEK